jgi:hypothetical protein
MKHQRNTNHLCSRTSLLLVAAVWACVPEGAESIDELRALDIEASDQVNEEAVGPRAVELGNPPLADAATHRFGADFNGDAYADLAISVPRDGLGEPTDEGSTDEVPIGTVNVLYGTAHGLTAEGDQLWHNKDQPDIPGDAGQGELFGASLAIGDFDADGYTDLAIGVPFDDNLAGSVNVLYGSPEGLSADGSQFWDQDQPGIEGEAHGDDHFATALTSGDFDGDGYDDLAIGVPFDQEVEGAVNVIYGSADGLTAEGNQRWVHEGGRFGQALAAGDFDGDGRDDLAIGVPNEWIGGIERAGQVEVLYGSADIGLTAVGKQEWSQDTPGIDGVAEAFDRFGNTLAVGDFDDDGYADLAIGVDTEDVGDDEDAGAVNVIYGSASGLDDAGDQVWHQNIGGIDGVAEPDDSFGSALAAGDFDGDGEDDLAIGVFSEDIDSLADAGWVNLLYGTSSGLDDDDDEVWHQDTPGVDGIAEVGDAFGLALTAGDFDGDGKADLAIGVPLEDFDNFENAGAINVLYGKSSGLDEDDDQVWNQDTPGVKGTANKNDQFGGGLR